MRSVGNGVSTSPIFPHSNLQSSLEPRHIKNCRIGFSKLWAASGIQIPCLWTRTMTPSKFFGLQLNQSDTPSLCLQSWPKSSRRNLWRSELAQEAPFVIAIGASIFSSFALVKGNGDEMKHSERSAENSDLDGNDMRDGAITIISFIPLFNWLGWVFAWLDTNEKRYLLYAIVYLAPYLRTGLSLSPDDSWLPVASIIACIAHVQLEINLKSGADFGNEFLRDAVKQIDAQVILRKLRGEGKKFAEQPEPNEQPSITEEELHRRELLEFDKMLSSEEKSFRKPDQIETEKMTHNPENSDD